MSQPADDKAQARADALATLSRAWPTPAAAQPAPQGTAAPATSAAHDVQTCRCRTCAGTRLTQLLAGGSIADLAAPKPAPPAQPAAPPMAEQVKQLRLELAELRESATLAGLRAEIAAVRRDLAADLAAATASQGGK